MNKICVLDFGAQYAQLIARRACCIGRNENVDIAHNATGCRRKTFGVMRGPLEQQEIDTRLA